MVKATQQNKYPTSEKAFYKAIIQTIDEGVIVTDRKGIMLLVNKAAKSMLGYTAKELLHTSLIKEVQMEYKDGTKIKARERPVSLVLATEEGITHSRKYFYRRKNGTKFAVDVTLRPIHIAGRLVGVTEVFRDITEEIISDQAKTEAISLASHALRTPLAVMKLNLDMIISKGYDERLPSVARKYFRELYKSNEHILFLVKDLLSLSRIDQGKCNSAPQETDIAKLLRTTIDTISILTEKKKLRVELFIEKALPSPFIEPLYMQEIIENLMSNAIKYSKPNGTISIKLSKKEEMLCLCIKDSGIGISKKDQKRLFTKFFRGANAIINTEGSGLGLYVVKSYVEGWGGEIRVESKKGEGCTFTVLIPIQRKHMI